MKFVRQHVIALRAAPQADRTVHGMFASLIEQARLGATRARLGVASLPFWR
jgi:hypothetical protein